MRPEDALILAKHFTAKTAEGMGAVKGKDGFSPYVKVEDTPDGHLITIIDATGPHSFEVKNGSGFDGEPYAGEYSVTPKAFESQTLATSEKVMARDVVVEPVPYAEASNLSGGLTAVIAGH